MNEPNFQPIIDELTYRNYCHNRMLRPDITPENWALIYPNVPEMEERYLKQFVAELFKAAAEEGMAN